MSAINNISNVQSSAAAEAPAKVAAANVHISNRSVSIRADRNAISRQSLAISQALSTSDVRTDKVASLQKAIADGSYNVSSSDVAGSLINALQQR